MTDGVFLLGLVQLSEKEGGDGAEVQVGECVLGPWRLSSRGAGARRAHRAGCLPHPHNSSIPQTPVAQGVWRGGHSCLLPGRLPGLDEPAQNPSVPVPGWGSHPLSLQRAGPRD